ncbi:ABC transporter ATP-binding protein [Patescibacteria group bacterium]|nr:ABC transporter ATP-binding protein [Patescibacteria group bacterium]
MPNGTNSIKNIIVFDHVGKVFEPAGDVALRDVSFSVRQGELVSLIGGSGCGKSTVLKIIAGLTEPSSGSVTKPGKVSMVFQAGALFPWLSVLDNVAIALEAKGAAKEHARKESLKYLEMVRLGDFIGKFPRELSGGQRQRVGIARALSVDPEVLLLDEPFAALDQKTVDEMHQDLLRIWKETGTTIILVSHLIAEAVALSERVLLMKAGVIAGEFPITIPRPRREQGAEFSAEVMKIRREFFK